MSEWQTWRARIAHFRLATKLNKEDGEVQVNALIYAMVQEADHIFKSFSFDATKDDDQDDYDYVLVRSDSHLEPKRKVMHERVRFGQQFQNSGEGG